LTHTVDKQLIPSKTVSDINCRNQSQVIELQVANMETAKMGQPSGWELPC